MTKVMFDELWIYSDRGEEMVSINIVFCLLNLVLHSGKSGHRLM